MLKEEVKKITLECAETALADVVRWKVGGADEKDLTHPIVSVSHMRYVIEEMYHNVVEKIVPGRAKGETYYLYIDDCPMGHLAYLIGTFMTLLIAEPEKIFVECYKSYEGHERRYIYDGILENMLEEMLRRFPQFELLTNISKEERDDHSITFVNSHPEITHVIHMGDQNDVYWRIARYRNSVSVHLPTATKVWVGYLSAEQIWNDKNLCEFGERCFQEVFDYDCVYNDRIEDADVSDISVGMNFDNCWTWKEYVDDEVRWRNSEPKVVDVLPVYIFGDDWQIGEALEYVPAVLRPVTKENFSFNNIYYDFSDLLKKTF